MKETTVTSSKRGGTGMKTENIDPLFTKERAKEYNQKRSRLWTVGIRKPVPDWLLCYEQVASLWNLATGDQKNKPWLSGKY